jgi:hypothetical protein
MKPAEVAAVLGRDVARYFMGANRPRVVGIRVPARMKSVARDRQEGSMPVLAAAAPLEILEEVRTALDAVGWYGLSFAAAHGAWLDAAFSGKGAPLDGVITVVDQKVHVVRLEGGDPVAVRQVPAADLESIPDTVGPGSGRVLVLAEPEAFEDLSLALSRRGYTASRDPEGWPGAEEGTAGRAATAALELVPPTLAEERRARNRKNAVALAGGAVVLILATLGAQLWGAHRELAAVKAEREAIQSEVEPLLLSRDSLNGLVAQVRSLEGIAQSSPVWTRSLVVLTDLLPRNTYLTGFFASGDTVELEAAGAQAGEAIQALREAGLFEEVRLLGLVERELVEGETVEERFRLWARLPGEGGEVEGS